MRSQNDVGALALCERVDTIAETGGNDDGHDCRQEHTDLVWSDRKHTCTESDSENVDGDIAAL